jgi:hypothetical protein
MTDLFDALRALGREETAAQDGDEELFERWADAAVAGAMPAAAATFAAGAAPAPGLRKKPFYRTPQGTLLFAAALVACVAAAAAAALLPRAVHVPPMPTLPPPPSPSHVERPAAAPCTGSGCREGVPLLPGSQAAPIPEVDIRALPTVRAPTSLGAPPAPSFALPSSTQGGSGVTAADLFREANALRAGGRRDEAERAYDDLERRFPTSSEAAVARVTLGRLYAQDGKTSAALAQFDAYLAAPGDGALREEALVGRASALEKLGDRAAERVAWKALLDAYPASASAAHARVRVAAD